MKTKKVIAMQIILVMLINLFLPYSVLLTKSYAAVTVPNPAAVITPITAELDSEGVIEFAVGITGDYKVYGTTFFLKFDNSKLIPAAWGRKGISEVDDMSEWEPIDSKWACTYDEGNSWWFTETGEIRIQTANRKIQSFC